MRYYFENTDSEGCYPKEYFYDQMRENGITEMTVYPAKIMIGESFGFCTEFGEPIETRTGDCGRFCEAYSPRNGKNGRCRHSHNCYEAEEVPITLRLPNSNVVTFKDLQDADLADEEKGLK